MYPNTVDYTPLHKPQPSRIAAGLYVLWVAVSCASLVFSIYSFVHVLHPDSKSETSHTPSALITQQRGREVIQITYPFAVAGGGNPIGILVDLPRTPFDAYVYVINTEIRFNEFTLGEGIIVNDINDHEMGLINWMFTLDSTWTPMKALPATVSDGQVGEYEFTGSFVAEHNQLFITVNAGEHKYITGLLTIVVGDVYPADRQVFTDGDLLVSRVTRVG